MGSECRLGHVEESRIYRDSGLWQNAAGTPPPPVARPPWPPLAAAPGGRHGGRPPRGLAPHSRACARGARGVYGRPGAMARESTSCAAITPWSTVSAARFAPVQPVWRCLRRETPEPQRPQGQTPRLCLLPLLGHRCVPLRGGTRLSEYPDADGSGGSRRLAGSLYVTGAPRATGGGISASVAARDPRPPYAPRHT